LIFWRILRHVKRRFFEIQEETNDKSLNLKRKIGDIGFVSKDSWPKKDYSEGMRLCIGTRYYIPGTLKIRSQQ